jgi:hypothetical protein
MSRVASISNGWDDYRCTRVQYTRQYAVRWMPAMHEGETRRLTLDRAGRSELGVAARLIKDGANLLRRRQRALRVVRCKAHDE